MEAHEPDESAQVVLRRLGEIARQEQVAILYAAESGSRAWGFPSPDSDYDVRFVYARAPAAYLSLRPQRDVIERHAGPDRLDIGGWDVAKALTLMLRANATLWEWLDSPVVYADDGVFAPAARRLFEDHASPRGLEHFPIMNNRKMLCKSLVCRVFEPAKCFTLRLKTLSAGTISASPGGSSSSSAPANRCR